MDCAPEEASGILWGAWNGEFDAGGVGEITFTRHGVPERTTWEVSTTWGIEYAWHLPIAKASPAQSGEVGYHLVPAWRDEVNKLEFEDRLHAINSHSNCYTGDGCFCKRGVENLLGECIA